ncbi:hypothetical protein COLO4_17042 [Corchorus olitorius]|uniref:Uncharacterized protein n=1 Tax=Corchorus olitorius TaxID=93759 RepID=A0A1R3JEG5_9ROSI|nr:hypothetical protein COLO4_17042 [Corchorus olitorius]
MNATDKLEVETLALRGGEKALSACCCKKP